MEMLEALMGRLSGGGAVGNCSKGGSKEEGRG